MDFMNAYVYSKINGLKITCFFSSFTLVVMIGTVDLELVLVESELKKRMTKITIRTNLFISYCYDETLKKQKYSIHYEQLQLEQPLNISRNCNFKLSEN